MISFPNGLRVKIRVTVRPSKGKEMRVKLKRSKSCLISHVIDYMSPFKPISTTTSRPCSHI